MKLGFRFSTYFLTALDKFGMKNLVGLFDRNRARIGNEPIDGGNDFRTGLGRFRRGLRWRSNNSDTLNGTG